MGKASASVKKAATSMSLRRRRTWGKSVSKAAKGSNKDEDLEDELNLEWAAKKVSRAAAAKKVSCSALKAHKAALQGAIAAYKKAPASKKKALKAKMMPSFKRMQSLTKACAGEE